MEAKVLTDVDYGAGRNEELPEEEHHNTHTDNNEEEESKVEDDFDSDEDILSLAKLSTGSSLSTAPNAPPSPPTRRVTRSMTAIIRDKQGAEDGYQKLSTPQNTMKKWQKG